MPPVYLTLGNHDDCPTFLETFPGMAAETGKLDHVIDQKGYRVIVLDSSFPGLGGEGRIEPGQLDWLKARLAEAAEMPVVIVLHHNITALHVQTDSIILEGGDTFAEVVKTHGNVRQIISGHVHMTTAGSFHGIPFSTLAGGHYSIEPTLLSRSGAFPAEIPQGYTPSVLRREGPGQLAVVLCDAASVVVHMENFLDRHLQMPRDLFLWES